MAQLLDRAAGTVTLSTGDTAAFLVTTEGAVADVTVTVTDGAFDPDAPAAPPAYDLVVHAVAASLNGYGVTAYGESETYGGVEDPTTTVERTGLTDYATTVRGVPNRAVVVLRGAAGADTDYAVSVKAYRGK